MGDVIAEDTLIVELEDGTVIHMKVMLTNIKEAGVSPFGGVAFSANINTYMAYVSPERLREKVKDRPVNDWQQLPPPDGWEIVDIKSQRPAVIETTVNTSKGPFSFRVVTEATMAARNMNYRTPAGDPVYQIAWVYKSYWKPAKITTKDVSPGEPAYTHRVN